MYTYVTSVFTNTFVGKYCVVYVQLCNRFGHVIVGCDFMADRNMLVCVQYGGHLLKLHNLLLNILGSTEALEPEPFCFPVNCQRNIYLKLFLMRH